MNKKKSFDTLNILTLFPPFMINYVCVLMHFGYSLFCKQYEPNLIGVYTVCFNMINVYNLETYIKSEQKYCQE